MSPGASQSTHLSAPESVRLGIADLVFRYEASDPRIRFSIRDSIAPFVIAPAPSPADCVLRYSVGPVVASAGDPAFTGRVWELRYGADGSEEIVFGASGPWAKVTMDPAFSGGTIVQSDQAEDPYAVYPGDYPIAEYLACRLIGRRGGLHLHASSVIFDGRAYVFLGHSGAGKSTLAGLAEARGGSVLSDDRTIITLGPDGAVAWGTPWHGSLQRTSAGSAPVAGFCLLVQASRDFLSPAPPSGALKEVFVRLIQPRVSADEVGRSLEAIARLLELHPLQRFEFTPSGGAIDYLREAWR